MVTESIRITPSGSVRDYRTLPRDVTEETTQEATEVLLKERPTLHPGVRELRWFHDNRDAVANYRGLWIAILGGRIVASEATFEATHDRLLQQGLTDALIVQVPDDPAKWDHLLA